MNNNCTRKIIFIVILFISTIHVSAQENAEIDSLLQVLHKVEDTTKVNVLIEISEKYNRDLKYDEALKQATEAHTLSKKLHFIKGEGRSLYEKAMIFRKKGELDTAERYYYEALALSKQVDDYRCIAKSRGGLGIVYSMRGEYQRAIDFYLQSLKLWEAMKDSIFIASNLNNIAIAYLRMEDHNRALEYFFKALGIAKSLKNERNIALTLLNIGAVYHQSGNLDKALEYYNEALPLSIKLGKKNTENSISSNMGSIYMEKKDYPKALKHMFNALRIDREVNDKSNETISLHNIGECYARMNKLVEAKKYALLSWNLASENNYKYMVMTTNLLLFDIYKREKNYQEALNYHVSYKDMSDSIFNEEKSKQIAEMETKYESEKKDQEIALQSQKLELLSKNKQLETNRRNAFAGGLVFTFVLGFLVYNRQRLKTKKNKEIHTKEKEIYRKQLYLNKCRLQNTENELIIKSTALENFMSSFLEQNKLIDELKEKISNSKENTDEKIQHINHLLTFRILTDEDWEQFKRLYEEVYEGFFTKLKLEYPDITTAEIRLCALLKLNLTTKEIAAMLGLSSVSIKTYRHRVRKKFKLDNDEDLKSFILNKF